MSSKVKLGRRQDGLTLAEIVISLALLASLTVVVIGLFSKMLSSGGKQAEQGVARRLADKVLTKAVRQGPPGWGGAGTNYEDTVELKSGRSELTTKYTYQVQVDHVRSTDLGDLKRVQVQVTWWPDATDGDNMRMDRGRLSLNVDQLVYTGK